MTLWEPGFPEWERKIMLAPKTLSVVTGHSGHGKTTLFTQIWHQIFRRYNVPMFVATFENPHKPHLRKHLRTLYIGKLERDMTETEKKKADAWIDEMYVLAIHPDRQPTLKWLLDMATVAVVRHGCRIVQVDPWNRLESARAKDETTTEYVGRRLRTFYNFANKFNCHVQIVAHPAKRHAQFKDMPPTLEDISDSKNWDNMVDQGFVVHRPKIIDGGERQTDAMLIHVKSRFEELGYPCAMNVRLDLTKGRFISTDYEQTYH
jgi:twinkle protein